MHTPDISSTVEKACRIMNRLRISPMSPLEIIRDLGYDKSTVYRLLTTLAREGMIKKCADGHRYRMIIALNDAERFDPFAIRTAVLPGLKLLSHSLKAHTNAAILYAGHAVIVASCNYTDGKALCHEESILTYVHATSLGKALIMDLDRISQSQILQVQGMHRLTRFTVTDPEILLGELEKANRFGYTADNRETSLRFSRLAVPVRDASGRTVCSISTRVEGSVCYGALTPAQALVEEALHTAARDISSSLPVQE